MKKHFLAGVLCGALFMVTTSVFAASGMDAAIVPSKVTFFLANGFSQEVRLQEGEEVLRYNNKTYVPLRLFAESSGARVTYTQASPEADNMTKIDVHYDADEAFSGQSPHAAGSTPLADSRELQLQDMLVSMLLPFMNEKLAAEYSDVLTVPPILSPDSVQVKSLERTAAFRGFDFIITLDAQPIVGPHIPAGEDRFTYRISSSGVELAKFEHLKGPDPEDFVPNYDNLLK